MPFVASAKKGRVIFSLVLPVSYEWQATPKGSSALLRRSIEPQMAGQSFTYVYLLRSETHPDQVYVGQTSDLRQRLADHNAGKAKHTSKFRPWRLETYLAFSDPAKALEFEKYLKSASGIAFARKRLRSSPLTGTGSEECPS